MRRLVGTLLSRVVFQISGLTGRLWVSDAFVLTADGLSLLLPREERRTGAAALIRDRKRKLSRSRDALHI